MASISKKDEGVAKTEILIREICAEFADFLVEKNRKYGNSALDPVAIFSKSDPLETIRVRIDDKLNRIINQQVDEDEDVIKDLIGYFLLYKVAERIQAEKSIVEDVDSNIEITRIDFAKSKDFVHAADFGRLGYNEMTERAKRREQYAD